MTQEEIRHHRELKEEAARTLREILNRFSRFNSQFSNFDSEELDRTDPRIMEYCRAVGADPEEHNLYEILSVIRFFRLLGKYRWNRKRARRFFRFYELLRFNGPTGRQRYRLTPVQCFQFGSIFGFDDAEGLRLVRLAYLFVPRKFSKTTSAASLAVNDLYFGDHNSQAYVGANSYSQAKICFNEIRAIVRDIEGGDSGAVRVNREAIFFKDGTRDSKAECLAANARTRDGLNASLAIIDEYAQARNTAGANGADLKNVLTSSMGTRREPLTVIITTASDVLDGPCFSEIEGAKAVLRGELDNDRMFASLFLPDPWDEPGDPRTWRKVQPHIGVTVQEGYYANEWANAQMTAENMLTFRTKLLNEFVVNESKCWLPASLIREHTQFSNAAKAAAQDQDSSLIAAEAAKQNQDSIFNDQFLIAAEGRRLPCTVGIDLSVRNDFSAVTFGFYDEETARFHYITDYFIPEGGVKGHRNERLYREWAKGGYLRILPGEVIDYAAIVEHILRMSERHDVMWIAYDPAKSLQAINMLQATDLGWALHGFKQTNFHFTAPVQSFEVGLRTGHITFADNPITPYCFGNAVLQTDNMGNMKPYKRAENDKIDGVITILMSHAAFGEAARVII